MSTTSVRRPRRRGDQAAITRKAVVDAARRLFAEHGYAGTGTHAIVTAAGVGTRGALYHHFEDKEALFAEVFAAVTTELADEIERRADLHGVDPLEALTRRLRTFLTCVADNSEAQRVLLDGPVVLGWERFRDLECTYGLRPIERLLTQAAEAGLVAPPSRALAALVLATVDEAAMSVAAASDKRAACHQFGDALATVLDGLRVKGSRRPAPGRRTEPGGRTPW